MNQWTKSEVLKRENTVRLLSGATAGLAGGVVMAALLMAASAAAGQGFWFPMMQIAAIAFGLEALVGGFGTCVVGLIFHFVTAMALGAGYGWILPSGTGPRSALFLGVFCSIAVWALSTYTLLPAFDPIMAQRIQLTPVAWFAGHLIYGTALVGTPFLMKAFGRGEEPSQVEYRFDRAA